MVLGRKRKSPTWSPLHLLIPWRVVGGLHQPCPTCVKSLPGLRFNAGSTSVIKFLSLFPTSVFSPLKCVLQEGKGLGINWEMGVDIYVLSMLSVKQITIENLLHTTGAPPRALQGPQREVQTEISVCAAESLCCTGETHTTMKSNCAPIKN